MKGKTLIAKQPQFPTFELAHRIEGGQHYFEVSYGSSFNELYYEFTPDEFFVSPDKEELTSQLQRVGARWVLDVMASIAKHKMDYSTDQLLSMAGKQHQVDG